MFAERADVHGQVPTSVAAALHADLDDLAEVDAARLGDQELCDLTAELYRAEARLAAQRAIAWHHGNDRGRDALERDEAMLAGEAAKLSFWLFQKALAYWAQLADPDGTDEDAEARRARRRLHLSRTVDGSWKIDGLLDPVDGATLDTALRTIDDRLRLADRDEAAERLGREPICGDLRRSPAQRRADAFTELARLAMSSPPGARRPAPLVRILVGYETFAGRVCELADGTVLAPSDVGALLDEALIERAVFDGPARVLEVGQQRFFRGALRRAMELRDRTCWHPFCEEPAARCDGDHTIPHAQGGPTADGNSRPGCPFHNRIEPQCHNQQRAPPGPDP